MSARAAVHSAARPLASPGGRRAAGPGATPRRAAGFPLAFLLLAERAAAPGLAQVLQAV